MGGRWPALLAVPGRLVVQRRRARLRGIDADASDEKRIGWRIMFPQLWMSPSGKFPSRRTLNPQASGGKYFIPVKVAQS